MEIHVAIQQVSNHDAAVMLLNIASVIEMMAGNPFRVRAYRRAARKLLQLRVPASVFLTGDGELALPGLGIRLRRKLGELFTQGDMRFLHDLYGTLPAGIIDLMRIPGIGPRRALRLYVELGLESPEDVVEAAEQGNIQRLYRFGERSEANLAAAARDLIEQDDEQEWLVAA